MLRKVVKRDDSGQVYNINVLDGELPVAGCAIVPGRGQQEGEWSLWALWVNSAYRRRGIASHILWDIIRRAIDSNITLLSLWVNAENAPAIALYRRVGFRPVNKEGTSHTSAICMYHPLVGGKANLT